MITVFTAMLGQTDRLLAPTVTASDVRYCCFSDGMAPPPPYEWIRLRPEADPRLGSRRVKILADHPVLAEAEVTIWHDAAYRLTADPGGIARRAVQDLAAFRHPHRSRLEDEAQTVGALGLMPAARAQRQVAVYRQAGFVGQSLTSGGFLVRRLTDRVRAFNRAWWWEVLTWGWRDQLSLDYAAWRAGQPIHWLPGHYRRNPFALWQVPSCA